MRQRWFSARALRLHLALLVWSPGCLVAGWWQVDRALDGNALSYLYSVEWPVFSLVGIWAWWVLVHTDPDESVGARSRRRPAATGRSGAHVATPTSTLDGTAPGAPGPGADARLAVARADEPGTVATAVATPMSPTGPGDEEAAALATYNARLARLAEGGARAWRNG